MRALGALAMVAACGGGGASAPDAAVDAPRPIDAAPLDAPAGDNPGFVTPSASTTTSTGPADWSCRGIAPVPTTTAVALTGVALDYQNSNQIAGAMLELFVGDDPTALDSDGPTDNTGVYALTVPSGTARYGISLTAPDYMRTLALVDPLIANDPAQARDVPAISEGVATALPAIIGITREPGTVEAVGLILDCQNRAVENAIATVSNTSGEAAHRAGADTYYFDEGAGLPLRHDQLAATDPSGLFGIFQVEAGGTGYLQVWGIPSDGGTLELLAERPLPLIGDAVGLAAPITP
jgi:hypothetical protein